MAEGNEPANNFAGPEFLLTELLGVGTALPRSAAHELSPRVDIHAWAQPARSPVAELARQLSSTSAVVPALRRNASPSRHKLRRSRNSFSAS